MKSDHTLKAFITFRVVGDNLVPDEFTQLLKMQPTSARLKGKPYSTGRSENIIPSTNIWFFSTDTEMASNNVVDHIRFILFIFGFMDSNDVTILDTAGDRRQNQFSRIMSLKSILRNSSAKATMTLFWHCASGSNAPKIPEGLFDFLKLIDVEVEVDFDKDEDDSRTSTRRRSSRAA